MNRQNEARILKTHPAIWVLYIDGDGDRSMAYDGARIRCGRDDCEGFTDGLACPTGCGSDHVCATRTPYGA